MAQRTPGAWLELLERRLHERWAVWQVFDAYYNGTHSMGFVTAMFRAAFGARFGPIIDNWMPIVVDAPAERLHVQGFRFGTAAEADSEAWDIWQGNLLDADADMVHTEAIKLGEAYWLVQPNGDLPKITSEHPSQVIVAHGPGDRKTRLAALKKWLDGGFAYANVYLPDMVVKYRTESKLDLGGVTGGRMNWKQIDRVRNPLGIVPVVPMVNNPTMLGGGRSDLAGGPISLQNAINKLLADMLVGSEYMAFPQRVMLGVDSPQDQYGNPVTELQASKSRLWYFSSKDARVAEFTAADLEKFGGQIELLVQHLAAQTRTPPHYVLGQMVNVSGDALKAAETGLVSKVRDKMDTFAEGHEETMRLAFRSIDPNDERANTMDAETIWRDPESRSQAETVDAAVKLASIGVPQEALWERIGASPQEIDRWKTMQEAEELLPGAQEAQASALEAEVARTNGEAATRAVQPV